MAEHLVVGDLGALLLVLGLTGPVLAPVLRIALFDRLRALAHPVAAFALWAVDLYLWHLPVLHEAAVRHAGVHALQHACFVAFGVNMWIALLGPLPKPAWFGNAARLVYIVAVRLAGAVLGNVLVFGGQIFYGVYAPGERAHGISAAGDQNAAGAIMMIEGSIVTLLLFGWLFQRTAREGEERQELLDLAAARGVELSEARAARAVAAGSGQELRRRIEGAPR
jgi:cytochrome c oxidase assembly factor CtaG